MRPHLHPMTPGSFYVGIPGVKILSFKNVGPISDTQPRPRYCHKNGSRRHECLYYDSCLFEAAKKGMQLSCEDCRVRETVPPDYSEEQVRNIVRFLAVVFQKNRNCYERLIEEHLKNEAFCNHEYCGWDDLDDEWF
jgi:hypothetical protein